jgi:flagellar hook-basal body complex protein FliE
MQIPGMNTTLNAATALATGEMAPAILKGTSTAAGGPFGDLLKSAVTGVNDLQQQASSAAMGMLAGDGVDIHDAMIATQKADMAFELTLAVRNKAVAAYQQVMGMQF